MQPPKMTSEEEEGEREIKQHLQVLTFKWLMC